MQQGKRMVNPKNIIFRLWDGALQLKNRKIGPTILVPSLLGSALGKTCKANCKPITEYLNICNLFKSLYCKYGTDRIYSITCWQGATMALLAMSSELTHCLQMQATFHGQVIATVYMAPTLRVECSGQQAKDSMLLLTSLILSLNKIEFLL